LSQLARVLSEIFTNIPVQRGELKAQAKYVPLINRLKEREKLIRSFNQTSGCKVFRQNPYRTMLPTKLGTA
jgi:hypothetical protein